MWDICDSICRRAYPRSSCWRNKGEWCPLIPSSPRGFITIFHSGSIYAEENGRKRAERSQCAASWAAARLDQTRQRKLWLHQNRSELNLSRRSWNLRKREIIISLFLIKKIFSGRRRRHFLPLERGGRIRYAQKGRLGTEHDRVERPLWTMECHERKACPNLSPLKNH